MSSVLPRVRSAGRRRWPLAGAFVGLLLLLGWGVTRVSSTPSPFVQVASENFTGSALDRQQWAVYSGSGQSGDQQWTPANCVVGGGVLTLRAEPDGSTCGIAWRTDQTYGAYEVRAKFDAPAAPEFDTTFIAWPQDDSAWKDAEIDYVEETDPARQSVTGFVHCTACPNGILQASAPVDMTTWHVYRVEWTPAGLRFLIDGTPWFTTTDRSIISGIPHHPTLQTDYTDDGQTPIRTTTEIDWIKIYSYQGAAS